MGPLLPDLIAMAAISRTGDKTTNARIAIKMSKILGTKSPSGNPRVRLASAAARRARGFPDGLSASGGGCDQADQGHRKRGVLCTRATEDADMRRSHPSPGS